MIDTACKPLGEQLQKRRANGLVDIKFFVHKGIGAKPEDVCAEAQALFDAADAGKAKDFAFADAPAMSATA